MKRIASFSIDHDRLLPGIYLSRVDTIGNETVSTFDLRMKRPNTEPAINTAALHTIEHLAATWLRNSAFQDEILYFGPMGCRTGNYLLLKGEKTPQSIAPMVIGAFQFIVDFHGPIPGARSEECGNFLDHNLAMAQYESKRYLEVLNHLQPENLIYPQPQ